MSIVFDHPNGEVYVDSPAQQYPKQEYRRDYYYRPENESPEAKSVARMMVNRMQTMYELGKTHRSLEIRSILGV